MSRLQRALAESAAAVTDEMERLLPKADGLEARVFEGMRYAIMAGGKRLRPFLVMTAAQLFNVAQKSALRVAAAVEMIHTYSLVHDDLPAMDNDDLRRGQPTCHVKFGEATAILVGDALLTHAFGILTDPATHSDPEVRCELVSALAAAAGAAGMVGGQMMDLEAENRPLDIGAITRLQRLKTGELIAYSCEAGAILGKAPAPLRHALKAFAHDLGLAFQIADDLLDTVGSEEDLGKKVGKDASAGKATFVSILGVERARAQALMLAEQAVAHLDLFEEKADLLRDVARFVVERRK
ncbi:MAG TPA: farnesyl diphosphate synthase [Alphaproteobacteria bacterium]|nr:farnesyl diphosphate synthase [Alphaproteobacteria bacterium]